MFVGNISSSYVMHMYRLLMAEMCKVRLDVQTEEESDIVAEFVTVRRMDSHGQGELLLTLRIWQEMHLLASMTFTMMQ